MPAPKVRSKDPIQAKLRDHKRQWNGNYRAFSQKLKAFKDGLNGRGNAKIGLQPSNIKDPLPTEIGSFLGQLASEFQSLVSDAEAIIAEQAQYARTRRKKAPKAPAAAPMPNVDQVAPIAAPEQDKVVDTLSRLGSVSGIEKEASNKLTRFWQYLSSIFSSKEYNKQRVSLLSQSADIYYSLLDFENDVLSLSVKKIPTALSKYKTFKYNFEVFTSFFDSVVEMISNKAEKAKPESNSDFKSDEAPIVNTPEPEQPISQPSPPTDENFLDKMRATVSLLYNANLVKNHIANLSKLVDDYEKEDDPTLKNMFKERAIEYYTKLFKALSAQVQKKYGPIQNLRSMQDIVNHIKKNTAKKSETISDYMVKKAHNAMTRYLKKKLISLAPSNASAAVRLEIVNAVDDMKIFVRKIMDHLEKDISIIEIKQLIDDLETNRVRVREQIKILNKFYMKEFFEEHKQKNKHVSPDDDEMMDLVLRRKLKRELSEDLS